MLYSRMSGEGYIPPLVLRTALPVAKLMAAGTSEDELLSVVSDVLDNKSFSEDALREFVKILVEGLSAPLPFVDKVVYAFIAKRGPDTVLSALTTSYIARAHIRAGDKKGAARFSLNLTAPPPPTTPSVVVSPYTTLLRDLGTANPSFNVYQWALTQMQAEDPDLMPDLAFFNSLLAHELGRRKYGAVFAIYKRLFESRAPPVVPDSYTFSTLFRALHRLSCVNSRHTRRSRNIRAPNNMPTAHEIFRDMLVCRKEQQVRINELVHFGELDPASAPALSVLDSTVLHKALRVFLGAYDYPAAFVALRTRHQLDAALPLATYRLVIGALLGRVRGQLPHLAVAQVPEEMWAFRFLGLGDLPPHRREVPLDAGMVCRLLRMGAEGSLGLPFVGAEGYDIGMPADGVYMSAPPRYDEAGQEFYAHGMPTPREFLGLDAIGYKRVFSVTPLERILKRAILASAGGLEVAPGVYVSAAIKQAKERMIPGK